jgi:diketogulonate reductase-like aldo/keto reductase
MLGVLQTESSMRRVLLPSGRAMPVLGQGTWYMGEDPGDMLQAVAQRHGVTPAQIALAWLLHQEGVAAIPKAVQPQHVRENRAALDIVLAKEDLAELDAAFPRPERKVPLAMR